jgi:hypothetical protein
MRPVLPVSQAELGRATSSARICAAEQPNPSTPASAGRSIVDRGERCWGDWDRLGQIAAAKGVRRW